MEDYSSTEFSDAFDNADLVSRGEAKRLAKEEVKQTLAEINLNAAQAQAGIAAALREVTTVHPDFAQQREQMIRVLEEIPLLKGAVQSAEQNPELSAALPQLYEIAWRVSQAPGSAPAASEPKAESERPESPRPSNLTEDAMYQGALASQRVNLSRRTEKTSSLLWKNTAFSTLNSDPAKGTEQWKHTHISNPTSTKLLT